MNNPFSRFKNLTWEKSDPMENHATECLAACLVFSKELRDDFIKFLFEDNVPAEIQMMDNIDITTQETLGESGEFGRADILLSLRNHFNIIIEDKVNAKEDGRHGEQLNKYRQWLEREKNQYREHPFLFTLVKTPDDSFPFQKYNVKRRLTWRGLHKRFKEFVELTKDETGASLANKFCDYLESMGIVSTYDIKDMQCYGAGLKAQRAVTSILNQVGGNLKAAGYEFELIDGNKDRWPQLKIQNPSWNKIFGNGDNYKIIFWFTVPPIWGAVEHTFYPELYLWHDGHGNDWSQLKLKLPQWVSKLEKEYGLEFQVTRNWKKESEPIKGSEISALLSKPGRIYAYRDKDIINMELELVPNEAELVTKLSNQAKEFAGIFSSLGG